MLINGFEFCACSKTEVYHSSAAVLRFGKIAVPKRSIQIEGTSCASFERLSLKSHLYSGLRTSAGTARKVPRQAFERLYFAGYEAKTVRKIHEAVSKVFQTVLGFCISHEKGM